MNPVDTDANLFCSALPSRREFLLGSAAFAAMMTAAPASAAQPFRIAISLIDLPRMWGSPDGGFEGMRFGGYTVYDFAAHLGLEPRGSFQAHAGARHVLAAR